MSLKVLFEHINLFVNLRPDLLFVVEHQLILLHDEPLFLVVMAEGVLGYIVASNMY